MLPEIIRFPFCAARRDEFRSGALIETWCERYPQLFDGEDQRVMKTDHQKQFHFFEWLAAVLLFEATGYRSLVEKYTTRCHAEKRRILAEFIPPVLCQWVSDNESGQPDLFIYEPHTRDWCFREVKGGPDQLSDNQKRWIANFSEQLVKCQVPPQGKFGTIEFKEL